MQANRSVLTGFAIVACLVVVGLTIYAPVLLSWMDRTSSRPATRSGDAVPFDIVMVRHSWVMQKADLVYLPLMTFHAWLNGYKMHEIFRGDSGSVEASVFFPKDAEFRD